MTTSENNGTPAKAEIFSRFLDRVPALALAMLCLRTAELAAGIQAGAAPAEIARLTAAAFGQDLLSLVRFLPLLFLCSLPFLFLRPLQGMRRGLGLAWSLLLAAQYGLIQYFLTARVPLGSDLFAYSWSEIKETVSGGAGLEWLPAAGLALGLACLWAGFAALARRRRPLFPPKAAMALLALTLPVLAFAPARPSKPAAGTDYSYNLALNKTAYFISDGFAYFKPAAPLAKQAAQPGAPGLLGFTGLDPQYPFLHAEQTPDALGPYFNVRPGEPPNLVFIIVEGLGRDFSGPGASLGSFTPRLDQLAETGLYWENFLAPQGRTFAVLPSVFGSLPFGANGFSDLGERMPAQTSLPKVLKGRGYRLKFYSGFDMAFDNERPFLVRQGMDAITDDKGFGAEYARANSWGYSDGDLVSRALAGEAADAKQPFLSVLQTITMHTPYTFPGQAAFSARFEERLDQLGVAPGERGAYRTYRNIYTSIMYTDEALGRFFEESKNNPAYQNTIFIVTGDHRLPEIPMGTRICRYHVPLLIVSPLLKTPARIKSVSSQFDIAPSLLAFLAHNYGLPTPAAVTWLGAGLDLEPSFRNVHQVPMKQTKTNLVDFLSGTWFLNQDALYRLGDNMDISPSSDAAALARVAGQFGAFRAANEQFAKTLALMPEGIDASTAPYAEETRLKPAALPEPAAETAGLNVREVRVPDSAKPGELAIEIVFSNPGAAPSETFVPLAVLMTDGSKELSESYGPPLQLPAGGSAPVKLEIVSKKIPPGRYFLAVIPSHPDTGKSLGLGRYRIPVQLK